jgi:hypothetical protein
MSKASKEALESLPDNTTENPFVPLFTGGSKRKHEGDNDENNGSFFWGEDSKRPKTTDTPKNGYVCKRCNVPGHYIKDCPQQQSGPPESYICNICKNPGHYIKDCPERQHNQQPRGEQPKCKFFFLSLSLDTLVYSFLSI